MLIEHTRVWIVGLGEVNEHEAIILTRSANDERPRYLVGDVVYPNNRTRGDAKLCLTKEEACNELEEWCKNIRYAVYRAYSWLADNAATKPKGK